MTDEYTNNAVPQKGNIPWYLNRNRLFLFFNGLFIVAFFVPLRDLFQTSLRSDYDSYIPFIPIISAYLIYTEKQKIFSHTGFSPAIGLPVAIIGVLLLFVARDQAALLVHRDYLAIMTLSSVLFWIGAFTLFYGARSMRAAAFPLMFLFFAVPIPGAALERIILFLQSGSADISYWFIQMAGIPVAREGFVFHMPLIDIEVAKQCSGIRSSLSLVITTLLASMFFLRSRWSRAILMLSVVPIAILKNGIRIAAMTIIGYYIDGRILDSDLHRRGGFLFFILALVLVWVVIVLLRRAEARYTSKKAKEA